MTPEDKKEYMRIYMRTYEKGKLDRKAYKKANREKLLQKNKEYYQKNKEKIYASQKEWVKNNRDKARERKRRWDFKNKDKVAEQRRNRENSRRISDPAFKIKRNLSRRIRRALDGSIKHSQTMHLTGCSQEELKHYLESLWKSGMSWYNYGVHGWHIDHIKPISSFNLNDPEEQKMCFHWTNLQPLWAKENMEKADKILPS